MYAQFLKLIQSALLELDLKLNARDFPGGPVVKTFAFQSRGVQVRSWFGELRSHMPHGQNKQNIKQRSNVRNKLNEGFKMTHIKTILKKKAVRNHRMFCFVRE